MKNTKILAPVKGKVIPLEQVPDEVFAEKVLGDGVAIIPEDGKIYSPVDGTITTITDSLHAYGFETEDGIQMIVHFGLETVNLKGKGFTSRVKVGDKVLCSKYAGSDFKVDGKEFTIIKQSDILAVVED